MKTVYLLRHAKSAWDDPDLSDHDRPLAPRGHEEAAALGQRWRDQAFQVDLAVTSSARRTRQTLDLIREKAGIDPPTQVEQELYLCGRRAWVDRLRRLPVEVDRVLVVGHNPDLHELALYLVGSGDKELRKALGRKFPTCACATVDLQPATWREIDRACGELVALETPATARSA